MGAIGAFHEGGGLCAFKAGMVGAVEIGRFRVKNGTRLQRWETGRAGVLGIKPQAVMECAFGAAEIGGGI